MFVLFICRNQSSLKICLIYDLPMMSLLLPIVYRYAINKPLSGGLIIVIPREASSVTVVFLTLLLFVTVFVQDLRAC